MDLFRLILFGTLCLINLRYCLYLLCEISHPINNPVLLQRYSNLRNNESIQKAVLFDKRMNQLLLIVSTVSTAVTGVEFYHFFP